MTTQQFEMLDCLADPVLVIDAGYNVIFANRAMVDLCGIKREFITGCKCHQLSHRCPRPCTEAELGGKPCSHAHVFSTGAPLQYKHRHHLPDGTLRIFDMTSSPLRAEDGSITHVIQVLRDITRQEELGAADTARKNELERLFTLAPFYIAAIDTDLRVRWINPATEMATGFQSRAIQGNHCYDLWGQYAADEGKRGAERICDGCKARQAMLDGKTYRHERQMGDRIFEIVTLPLTEGDGTIAGAIEFGIDITTHRKNADDLRSSERRLRTLFENSPTPLFVADFSGIKRCLDSLRQNGVQDLVAYLAGCGEEINECLVHLKILDANQAALSLVGLPSKEELFANNVSLLQKIPLHANPEGLLAIARGEKSASHELTFYSVANEKLQTILYWTVEPGYEQTYGRILLAIIDITDRKKAEETTLVNAERMRLLHEIDQAIIEAGSVEEIGQVTLDLLQRHVHCASGCVILFNFDNRHSSLLACSREVPSAFCADREFVFRCTEYFDYLHTGKPFLLENISEEKELCPIGETLLAEGFRFFISVPLLAKSGLLGVLNLLDTEPRSLPADQFNFICQVAPFLAVAIQNANFLSSLNRKKEELRTLTRRLADAEETERRRLAVELHDEVGQNLSALAINLDTLDKQLPPLDAEARKRLDDSVDLIDRLTGQVRTVMADLRPPVMDDYGLLASLQWLADSFSTRTGILVRVKGREARPRLSATKEIALFRIAQEALTNTAKHAGATTADIEMYPIDDAIRLILRDNGRGFDSRSIDATSIQHLGLLSMRERIELINGRFSMESPLGVGTTITVEVPV